MICFVYYITNASAEETLIFRQTLPTLFSAGMLTLNKNDPSNANFAILDEMEDFRGSDGKFHFKLKWPGDTTEYEWKQTSNPATETISGYEGINIPYTGQYWGGLERSNEVGNYALIDGSVGNPNWFYAIGSFEIWHDGIPAYAKTDGDYEYAKQSVELYVIAGVILI